MRAGFAAIALGAGLLAACGEASGGAFPEQLECVQPAPIATSRSTPGTVSGQAYIGRVTTSADTLAHLRSDLRKDYAEDTFYRRDEFRPDFAAYADETICVARSMLDLSAPDARFAKFETDLDAALTALIAHTEEGRESVRSRNVSDYRDWFRGADAKINAVLAASRAQR